ncbi:MAG: glycosyl hydrolase 53 family protein [Prevotella sp.]|nr:glycosyl hydrolase 53 family protein [Prevotella sp.]
MSAGAQRLVGGDMSLLPSYEAAGVAYFSQDGTPVSDVIDYVAGSEVGWNAVRLRLFVNPENATAQQKGEGVWQDISYILPLAQRVKAAGMKLLIDFHYSDSWADPAQQTKPKAWQSLSDDELAAKVYDYTAASLRSLTEAEATPDYVQIGNEISFGMLWPTAKVDAWHDTNWSQLADLLNSGAKACREICPQAKIIIHTEQAGDTETTVNYYKRLAAEGIDYDIIGLSYYPFWHKALSQLSTTLDRLAADFPDREVQIVETAYYYQWPPSSGYDSQSATWPATPEGQQQYAEALAGQLKKHSNVTALYWWFPEENGHQNSVISNWINRGLWDNNTGKALPALYVLKGFLDDADGITPATVTKDNRHTDRYSLSGQAVSSTTPTPISIIDGRKVLKK